MTEIAGVGHNLSPDTSRPSIEALAQEWRDNAANLRANLHDGDMAWEIAAKNSDLTADTFLALLDRAEKAESRNAVR